MLDTHPLQRQEALLTPELCLIAVKQHGLALRHVPEELCTPEVCQAAMEQDEGASEFVPDAARERTERPGC